VYTGDHNLTIVSNDRGTKAVTISQVGEKTVITAEQLSLRTLVGSHEWFLYDRRGERCPMDQLPKELQVAL
jgi:hypothetical protein